MRVLLVEDDTTVGEAVRDHVATEDHAVDWRKTIGTTNLAFSTKGYGLILLDLRLPDGSGIKLLKKSRHSGVETTAIILTAHDQIADRIEGLNCGADYYVVKTFDLTELTARMLAVSRRYSGHSNSSLETGGAAIDAASRRVSVGGEVVDLGREWAVIEALAAMPGAIVSKGQIEDALYAFGSEIESNTVEVYVSRLRKKLGREHIVTTRGVCYRLGQEE